MTSIHPLIATIFFVVLFALGNLHVEGAEDPLPARLEAATEPAAIVIGATTDAPRAVAVELTPPAELIRQRVADDASLRPSPLDRYGSLTPDQLRDGVFLSPYEALAACGPAAAVAFARAVGFDLALDDAVAVAREVGWTPWAGMGGPRNQVALLERLGIAAWVADAEVEPEIDWGRVVADVVAGNPVIISTPGHYYVAERYDPTAGAFLGTSAAVLRASGGQRWFTADQIAGLGYGEPTAVIHLIRSETDPTGPTAAPPQPILLSTGQSEPLPSLD